MVKFLKKSVVFILFIVWILAVCAADSPLEGWAFALLMFLCIAPLALVAYLCNKGWLGELDDDDDKFV